MTSSTKAALERALGYLRDLGIDGVSITVYGPWED